MNALDPRVTPREIVRHLDQYVIGQDEAKKTLAVAVYAHYQKLALSREEGLEITKSNVLLVGPTGTGKTLLCESLARLLKVPFVTADATSLAQSRYVNDEIQAILERLHDKAEGEVTRAQHGIVFIDEIDKLKTASAASDRGPSGESVQHALLKIMEGAPVRLASGEYLDTTNILFICGGAFVGLDAIMANNHGFGFVATSEERKPADPRAAERTREADRPRRIRPDPGIQRAAHHGRPAARPVARYVGQNHDRAAQLHLPAVPGDLESARCRPRRRAARVRGDRRPGR